MLYVAEKHTFHEIYTANYAFKQNEKSLEAHQKELCGPPVEKHCCKQKTCVVVDPFMLFFI